MKMPWIWYSGFGNCSWQIHGTFNQTEFQTVQVHGMFMALSPKNYFKNSHNWFYHVCVCLFVVSVFLMLFALMVFQVQVDHFFWVFFDKNLKVIREHPNHQAKPTASPKLINWSFKSRKPLPVDGSQQPHLPTNNMHLYWKQLTFSDNHTLPEMINRTMDLTRS